MSEPLGGPEAPTYTVTTERLYDKLPDMFIDADAQNEYALKTYLSSVVDYLGVIDLLIARLTYLSQIELQFRKRYAQRNTIYTHGDRPIGAPEMGSTSDLVDPRSADVRWLPWIGQLVGVKITPQMSDLVARDSIEYASSGYRAGSKDAIEKAVRAVLTGSKYAVALPHTMVDGDGNIMPGTTWDLTILTRSSESPSSITVIAAANKPTLKPAGVKLYHRTYQASWDALEASLPFWRDWETVTWDQLEQAGLSYRNIDGNLLSNPSFETGADGWTTFGAASQTAIPGGIDGSRYLRVDFSGSGNKGTESDPFHLDADTPYTCGITYKSTVPLVWQVMLGSSPVFTVNLPVAADWKRSSSGLMPSVGGECTMRVSASTGVVNDNFMLDGAVIRDATI